MLRHARPRCVARDVFLLLLALAALLDGRAAGAEDGQEGGGARIVMLWPEERHVFRSGAKIIAAIITSNFNPPHEAPP
ncbi:hypothetical protein T484DRAFT_1844969 [Baffinella frigidus]|nr:hypothetical protein T484DRAFT_1844969 [Cryptophyta sp. CCMP2293]